jgi:hypothetical protein
VRAAKAIALSRPAASFYFAITPFDAWNTQSLPVVVNHLVDLVPLHPRMLG